MEQQKPYTKLYIIGLIKKVFDKLEEGKKYEVEKLLIEIAKEIKNL